MTTTIKYLLTKTVFVQFAVCFLMAKNLPLTMIIDYNWGSYRAQKKG